MIIAIKLLHTLIWAVLAGSIAAIPILARLRRFRWVAILSSLVVLECLVLALNGGRCPLTDIAAQFTPDRSPNFDIYLPNWLARYNKNIFGALFVFGELTAFRYWRKENARHRFWGTGSEDQSPPTSTSDQLSLR
jgi:hypothetical protein